jgi:hypothetical protein
MGISKEEYLNGLPEERKKSILELIKILDSHLPKGFKQTMQYGMIAYVVPFETYPDGYHVNSKEPLPFIMIGSQKRHIGLYHMGLYADEAVLNWFVGAYPEHSKRKLNMGKSCVRFTNPKTIPFTLIKELAQKISVQRWIECYEQSVKR